MKIFHVASMVGVFVACTVADGLCAAGLPFHEDLYQPEQPNTVIAPLNQKKLFSLPSMNMLSETLNSLGGNIGELAGRNFVLDDTVVKASKELEPVHIESGYVQVEDIVKEGSYWIKIKFKPFALGEARLSIFSHSSGVTESFTGKNLETWNWVSPMLMGDRVRVQLQVPSGERMPNLQSLIDKVIVGDSARPVLIPQEEPGSTPKQSSGEDKERICGADNRKPSEERRVGRMIPIGCTVFIVEGGAYVTAGHCIDNSLPYQEVQFNVPLSTVGGNIRAPEPKDKYPIVLDTLQCRGCNGTDLPHGEEWAVFRLGENNETGKTAIVAQGSSYRISSSYEIGSKPITKVRVDGFGYSGQPPSANYTNQYSSGRFSGLASGSTAHHAEVLHLADTEQGNSGSPIVAMDSNDGMTDVAVGIHTGGRCNPPANVANKGTGFSNIDLKNAIEALKQ